MSVQRVDVAILGSGFGGSLTALVLRRAGMEVALVDRAGHPRFAIGESSTPVADLVLRDLCRAWDLPRILPLAKYGTWQAARPEILCGLKRGFSYFHHVAGRPFQPDPRHANELLVAASSEDALADTHWHRASVDAFLAREAADAGAALFERTRVELSHVADSRGGVTWRLEGDSPDGPVRIETPFVVDATGEAGVVLRHLRVPDRADLLRTRSRAIFAHFEEVTPWRDVLRSRGADVSDHPFPCDDAALHQVFDAGWMWQLRFRNGIVSAGFALDEEQSPLESWVLTEREWDTLLRRFPSLFEQFRRARLVAPESGLRRTGRMQRRAERAAGDEWVALPNTAGFIDPLHSSGIAHTLCGIERLAPILVQNLGDPHRLRAALADYEATVFAELELIDLLVSGCYRARRHFPLFVAFSMLYFAAATTYERRRLSGAAPGAAFLLADDPAFVTTVRRQWDRLDALVREGTVAAERIKVFESDLADSIATFNTAGLCDRSARNMYRFTALPDA